MGDIVYMQNLKSLKGDKVSPVMFKAMALHFLNHLKKLTQQKKIAAVPTSFSFGGTIFWWLVN